MKIPSKWRDIISCRLCKSAFIDYLGVKFLELGPFYLRGNQKLFIAGGSTAIDHNTCWCTTKNGVEEAVVPLTTNAEEADTRVWLHAKASYGLKKSFSPQTVEHC